MVDVCVSRAYCRVSHLTGTHQNQVLRDRLLQDLDQYGVPTRTAAYHVLLSYHDWWVLPSMYPHRITGNVFLITPTTLFRCLLVSIYNPGWQMSSGTSS